MQSKDWEKHYNAFKWAISRDWKDKNGLHRSIQHKIETLVQEYDLTEREILDELFFNAASGISVVIPKMLWSEV